MPSQDIKDYSIKLTTNVERLGTDTANTAKKIDKSVKSVSDSFKKMGDSAEKAVSGINKQLDKLSKSIIEDFKKVTATMVTELAEQESIVKASAQEKYNARKKFLDKYESEFSSHIRKLSSLEAQRPNAGQTRTTGTAPVRAPRRVAPAAPSGGTFTTPDISQISGSIESIRQLYAGLETTIKTVNVNLRNELQKLMSENVQEVDQAAGRIEQILSDLNRRGVQEQEEHFDRRIQLARENGEQTQTFERQRAVAIEQLNRQHQQRITEVQTQANQQRQRVRQQDSDNARRSSSEAIGERRRELIQANREQGRFLRESQRRLRDAQRDIDRTLNRTPVDILNLDPQGTIDDIRDLGPAIRSTVRETQLALQREMRNLSSNRVEDIAEGERNITNILERERQTQLNDLREFSKRQIAETSASANRQLKEERARLRREIAAAGDNDELKLRLEREFQERRREIVRGAATQRARFQGEQNDRELRMQRQHQARVGAVSRTAGTRRAAAPSERQTGRLGNTPIFSSITDEMQGLTAQAGPLGGILQKLGPAGIIAGVGIAGLTKVMFDATKANQKFIDDSLKIKTLLTEKQATELPNALNMLRETAKSTGEGLESLQNGLFNVISATPALADNVGGAAIIVDKLSKTAKGLGAETDQVVLAASNLGNALGLPLDKMENLNLISDVLANTMKQGLIPDSAALSSNISKTAPLMGFLFENTNEAAKSIGALTATMTANGVSVDESQTKIKALFLELGDPKKQTQLFKKNIEGINKETGKIEDIRKVFQSMGKDIKGFDQILSSSEAKDALKIFTKEGGDAMSRMMDTFDNAGGTAQFMFETMASSGKNASERLTATMTDIQITMGESTNKMMTSLKLVAVDTLGFISELIKSDEQLFIEADAQFGKATKNVEQFNKLVTGTTDVLKKAADENRTTGDDIAGQITAIGQAANEFKDVYPFIAENIKKIGENGVISTETLALMNVEIQKAQELAKGEQLVSSFETAEAAIGSLGDRLTDLREGVFESFQSGEGGLFAGIGRSLSVIGDTIDLNSLEDDIIGSVQLINEKISAEIEGLKAERDALDQGTREGAEEAMEITKELNDLNKTRRKAGIAELETRNKIEQTLLREFENAKQLAESRKEAFDIEEAIAQSKASIIDTLDLEGKTAELVNELGIKKLETELTIAGKTEELINLKDSELDKEILMLDHKHRKLDLTTEEGRAEGDLLGAKIDALQIEKDGLVQRELKNASVQEEKEKTDRLAEQEIERGKALDALVESNRQITDEKVNQTQVDQELNQLIAQKLGTEKQTQEERINGLQTLKAEIGAQKDLLQLEMGKLKVTADTLRAQIAINSASGKASGQQSKVLAGLMDQITALNNQLNVMNAASAGLDQKIGAIQAKQTTTKAFGKLGGGKEQANIEKEQKRRVAAEKQARAEQDDLNKAIAFRNKKIAEQNRKAEQTMENRGKKNTAALAKKQAAAEKRIAAMQKQREDSIKKQIDINNKKLKIEEARIAAERRFIDDILSFRDKIEKQFNVQRDKTFDNIKRITDQFRSTADIILDSSKNVKKNFDSFSQGIESEVDKSKLAFGKLRNENIKSGRAAMVGLKNALKFSAPDIREGVKIQGGTKGFQESVFKKIMKEATLESGIISAALLEKAIKAFTEKRTIGGEKIPISLSLASKGLESTLETLEASNAKLGKQAEQQAKSINEILSRQGKETIKTLAEFEDLDRKLKADRSSKANAPVTGRVLTEKELGEAAKLEELAVIFNGVANEFDKLTNKFESAKTPEELGKIATEYDRLMKDLAESSSTIPNLFTTFKDVLGENAKNLELLTEEQQALINGQLGLLKRRLEFEQQNAALQRSNVDLIAKINKLEADREKLSSTVSKVNDKSKQDALDMLSPLEKINVEYREINKNIVDSIQLSQVLFHADQELLAQKQDSLDKSKGILEADRKQLLVLQARLTKETEAGDTEGAKKTAQELEALNRQIENEEDNFKAANKALDEQNEKLGITKEKLDDSTEALKNASDQWAKLTHEQQVNKAESAIDDLDPSNAIKFATGIGDAIDGIKKLKELGESEKALTGIAKVVEGVAGAVENAAALTEETITGMMDAAGKLRKGDTGGGVQAIGDVTKKIGMALINSGIPQLALAGAIMLGAGVITGIVGKIISAVKGEEKSSKQIAEEKQNVLEEQVAIYEAQLAIVDRLNSLGKESVDTEQKRLDILRKEHDILVANSEEVRELQGVSDEDLADMESEAEARKKGLDTNIALLEASKGLGLKERGKLAKSLGFDMGLVVSQNDVEEMIGVLETERIDIEGQLTAIGLELDFRSEEFESLRGIINEEIATLDFTIKANVQFGQLEDALELAKQQISLFKPIAEAAFQFAGETVDLTGMTAEQVEEFISTLDQTKFPPDAKADIEEYISLLKKSTTIITETFSTQIDLIRARQRAGRLTTEEADEEVLRLLEEELELLEEKAILAGEANLFELERLAIEAEILGITEKQNEEEKIANEQLSEAITKRQELLKLFRETTQGGTLSTEQQGELQKATADVKTELVAAGFSDKEIEDILADLPQFDKGGDIAEDQVVKVHKGERIIPASVVRSVGKGQINDFLNQGFQVPTIADSPEGKAIMANIIRKENPVTNISLNMSIGDFVLNNSFQDNMSPQNITDQMLKQIQPGLFDLVNKGIQERKINPNGGK